MNNNLLRFSIFNEVLFPKEDLGSINDQESLSLRRAVNFIPSAKMVIESIPLVVFDFETTGLDSSSDEIIEIGAQKILGDQVLDEMSTLIYTDRIIPPEVEKITGINQSMLEGCPTWQEVLPKFLKFIDKSILVAHNASFDCAFLREGCLKEGIDLNWPAFCTLKLARELLPDLERKNLDTLAEYYNLTFESRHRSIGDVKVTSSVLKELLSNEGSHLKQWKDFDPYKVQI